MRRHDVAVFLGYAAFFIAFFSPVLWSGRYFGDAADALIETIPAYEGPRSLWESRTMLGFPMFTASPVAYFYPLVLLRAIPHSFNGYIVCAYAVAAFGTFGFVRGATGSRLGGFISGLIFSLSGFFIGHLGHADIIEPAAWAPFVLWGLGALRRRDDARPVALVALALALTIVAGQPQIFVYLTILAIAYVVAMTFVTKNAPGFVVRALVGLSLGIGIAAVAIVPEIEVASQSTRAHLSIATFMEYAIPAGELPLRLFFPYLLGRTTMLPYRFSDFDFGSFAEMSDTVGIGTLAFALIGSLSSRHRAEALFWSVVAVIALGLGADGLLARAGYAIPGYDLFRAPGRHALEFTLAVCWLAGGGIAAIARREIAHRTVVSCFAIVGVSVIGCAFGIARFGEALPRYIEASLGHVTFSRDPFANAALFVPIATFACTALATMAFARRQAVVRTAVFLIAIVAELCAFASFAYWNYGAFGRDRIASPAYAAALRSAIATTQQRVLTIPGPAVGAGIAPNLNLLWDIPSARGYEPLEPASSARLVPAANESAFLPLLRRGDVRLDIAAVRFVIVPARESAAARRALDADPDRFRQLTWPSPDAVYENRRAYARAWYADPATPLRPREFVHVHIPNQETMTAQVACPKRCLFVTGDIVYPGWSATVDGTGATIRSVDYGLRGVVLPRGQHLVRFAYRPTSLFLGSIVSCVAIGLLALYCAIATRRGMNVVATRGA